MPARPAQFAEKQIEGFMGDVNSKLRPVLELVHEPRDDLTRFRIRLRPTKYAMMDQVTINDEFQNLIRLSSNDYFGVKPTFNMNGTVFWYYVEVDDE